MNNLSPCGFVSTQSDAGVSATSQNAQPFFTGEALINSAHSTLTSIPYEDIKAFMGMMSDKVSGETLEIGADIFCLIYRISHMKTFGDLMVTAIEFLKSRFGVQYVLDHLVQAKEIITELINELYKQVVIAWRPQTESRASDFLKSIKDNFQVIVSSEIVTAVRNFILSLVSFRFFSRETTKSITNSLGPARETSAVGMIEVCLETAISVFEFTELAIAGTPLRNILIRKDAVAGFLAEAEDLYINKDLTYSGMPVQGMVDRVTFLNRVKDAIESGRILDEKLPMNDRRRKALKDGLTKMVQLRAAFMTQIFASSRNTPMLICLTGNPGIGKGLLLDYVASLWSKVMGRDFDTRHVYHRQSTEDYWSGYEPLSQPIIHYSEPGSLHRGIASKTGDPQVQEMLSVADNQPFMCNMADVKDKGNVFALPELVIMDCNNPALNLNETVNNPAAVRRRILYVHPTVKKEFLKPGTCQIDQQKSLASDKPMLDRWNFEVYTMKAVDLVNSSKEVLARGDIYETTRTLKNLMVDHVQQQAARVNLTNNLDVTEYLPKEDEEPLEELEDDFPIDDLFEFSEDDELIPRVEAREFNYDSINLDDYCILTDGSVLDANADRVANEDLKNFIIAAKQRIRDQEDREMSMRRKWYTFVDTYCPDFVLYYLLMIESYYYNYKPFAREVADACGILFCHVLWHMLFYAVWFGYDFAPNSLIAAFARSKFKSKMEMSSATIRNDWQRIRSTLGLSNTYKVTVVRDNTVYMMIAAMTSLLFVVKMYKVTTSLTEGNMLSSSGDVDETSVDAHLTKFEKETGAQLPPPRKAQAHNSIDWSGVNRPIPVPITHQAQLNDLEKVYNAVQKNVRHLTITGKQTFETHATGICRDFAVLNRHSLLHPRSDGTWTITIRVREGHESGIARCIIDENEIATIEGDLILVRLRGCIFSDIRKYIPKTTVSVFTLGAEGLINGVKTRVKAYNGFRAQTTKGWPDILVKEGYKYSFPSHAVGHCGLPLVCKSAGASSVVGFHIAGAQDETSFAQASSLSQIDVAVVTLESTTSTLNVNSEGRMRLPPGTSIDVVPHKNSPLRFENVESVHVVGRLDGYTAMKLGSSKLVESPLVKDAETLTGVSSFDADGNPLFGPPPFAGGMDSDGVYRGPYNEFVKKVSVVKKPLDPRILSHVVNLLTTHLVTNLRKEGVTDLAPVTLDVAQNGFPEDFYMRAMKPSTSGGWPWPGAKKKYSEQTELSFKKDAYVPLFDVKEQVYEQLAAYAREETAMPILGAQLKDEPRSFAKIKAKKTRVFCMSPYESTLVNRMYLMPIYSLMVAHGEIFRTAIGINMHSTDVDRLIGRLTSFSDKFMEGDYGGFDTSMPYDIGLAANTVVYNLCKEFGYNAHALRMVQGILSDNLYPFVMMRGDMFFAPALQPSGKYATAEDNSLRGLIMLLYAWVSLTLGECADDGTPLKGEDFFTSVLPVIYGDDVVAAVKPEVQHIFNNKTYQKFCREIFGIDYTNAAKTSDMEEFLVIDQISFLKRNFIFREDLGHWVAPLDRTSIMKSIVYYLPSRSVSTEEQVADSCVSAMRELFFHLNEREFNERRRVFVNVISDRLDLNRDDVTKIFPTFAEIQLSVYGRENEQ